MVSAEVIADRRDDFVVGFASADVAALAFHLTGHRPHPSLNLKPPDPTACKLDVLCPTSPGIERRDRLGSLIYEYSLAA